MNRQEKRSHTRVLLLFAVLLAVLPAILYAAGKISSFVPSGPPGSGFSEPPVSSAESGSSQEAAPQLLRGTVEDATMNTLTLRGRTGSNTPSARRVSP